MRSGRRSRPRASRRRSSASCAGLARARQARLFLGLRRLRGVVLGHLEQARLAPRLARRTSTRVPRRADSTAASSAASSQRRDHLGPACSRRRRSSSSSELLDHARAARGPRRSRRRRSGGRPARRRARGTPARCRRGRPDAEPSTSKTSQPSCSTAWRSLDVAHRLEPVAQQRRLLELARRRRGRHVLVDVALRHSDRRPRRNSTTW